MLGLPNYLWRLIPANPILLRVVESGGKRKRDLLIRCAYLGILLFIVIFLLLQSAGNLANASLSQLSQQSGQIFRWMSYVQLALVALLAPVFTAGAITQEKDSQTYDILLSTPLTNGQIVLGSLLSRLFFVVALLVSGIPIFSITQVFGGVAIRDIVHAFLIAAATAFITGAIAMAIAVFKVGTRRTIFSFYLVILLYLAIPMTLEAIGYLHIPGGKKDSHINALSGIHPFLALRCIFGDPAYAPPELAQLRELGYRWPWTWYYSSPHTFYSSFMFFLSFVIVAPSILVLRRLAQSTSSFRSWLLQKLRISSGDRTRKPRYVWANPIAWREARTKASANRAILLRYGFMTAGVLGALALVYYSNTYERSDFTIASGGYDAASETVTIVENNIFNTYTARPGQTYVKIGGGTYGPQALRGGLVIEPKSIMIAGKDKLLASITVSNPKPTLDQRTARQFLLGAMMIELAVILLIVTQSAASTVTREKEDGTLDLLLSTPITSRYYIWGKLRGLVSFVLPLVAVPLASVIIFVAADLLLGSPISGAKKEWTVFPEAIIILPVTLVMVCAFAAMVGMHMSLRCRKTVVAVMSSVGIVAGVCGALWLCGHSAAGSDDFSQVGVAISTFSPFTLMALLTNPLDITTSRYGTVSVSPSDIRPIALIFGYISAFIYGLIVYAMYQTMVKNFDMTIRKQSS